jgi:type IV pilus assembly protein PilC
VLGFAVVITFVIIIFMVPTFQDIYEEIGAELPIITQVIIFIGNLFKQIWFYIVLIVLVVGGRFLFRKILSTPSGREVFDRIKISLPKFGALIKTISLARLNRQFGILLKTGVPILSALDIVRGVADNIHIDNALLSIKKGIREGENISEPMSKFDLFPPMMVQMISVGERTGNLDEVVNKVADFYEEESSTSIDTMITVLEPMMLLIVALVIGMIVISMYLPMFNVYQNM